MSSKKFSPGKSNYFSLKSINSAFSTIKHSVPKFLSSMLPYPMPIIPTHPQEYALFYLICDKHFRLVYESQLNSNRIICTITQFDIYTQPNGQFIQSDKHTNIIKHIKQFTNARCTYISYLMLADLIESM